VCFVKYHDVKWACFVKYRDVVKWACFVKYHAMKKSGESRCVCGFSHF
jgi:hypothetical protein